MNQVQLGTGNSQIIATGMVQMTNHQGETRVIPLYQARQYMQVARQNTKKTFGFGQVSGRNDGKTKIEIKNKISKNVKSISREKMKKMSISQSSGTVRAGQNIQSQNHVIIGEWTIEILQSAGQMPTEISDAINAHLNGRDLQGLRNVIILNSGATEHTFCNGEFLRNIETSSQALDLHTNVGSRSITQIGRFGNYEGDVWYDPDGIANVISLSRLTGEGYQVYMDTDDDDAIFVYSEDGRHMRFEARLGLYVYL